MSDITKATVVAARAAREIGYVTRKEGAFSMAALDCIEHEHFDTIDELSRQQHEALLVGRQYMESGNKPTSADRQTVDAVLALWPDDPMEEVEG